jgi:hypothetical protein
MTTEVRIFDPLGNPLADPRVVTTRSWIINDIGDASFSISTSDPACTSGNLRFGNILVINHDELPPWVGFIDSGGQARKWENGEVGIYAQSAEKIVDWRYTRPIPKTTGTAGELLRDILEAQDKWSPGGIELYPGSIFSGGHRIALPTKPRLGDLVRKFSKSVGCDWSVTHKIIDGKVRLYFNWYNGERGVNTGKTLNQINTKGGAVVLIEEGEIYNDVVFMSSPGEDGKVKYSRPARDPKSIGRFGLKQYVGEGVGSDEDGLWVQGLVFLYEHAYPKGKLEPTILDTGGIFSYVNLGNRYLWETSTAAFSGGGHKLGAYRKIRLVGFEALDDTNEVNSTVEIVEKPFDIYEAMSAQEQEI